MVHVLAIEYPGYGVYPGSSKAPRILEDADNVFTYITEELNWNPRDIIIFGRSIGSGPAVWLAS
jgi:acetyl esterase/lipase